MLYYAQSMVRTCEELMLDMLEMIPKIKATSLIPNYTITIRVRAGQSLALTTVKGSMNSHCAYCNTVNLCAEIYDLSDVTRRVPIVLRFRTLEVVSRSV